MIFGFEFFSCFLTVNSNRMSHLQRFGRNFQFCYARKQNASRVFAIV